MVKHGPLIPELLSLLDKATFGINLKQSSLHRKKVEFLSYIVSERGIEISEKKIEDVRN